jgi:hypothetical protein
VATPAANGRFLSLVCWVLPTLQTITGCFIKRV